MLRRLVLSCAIACAVAPPGVARADDAASPAISAPRRAAAITLAIVPGVAARGLGSHVARRPHTARRLLLLGGVGFGAALVGGIPVGATYGSGKVVVPGVHLVVGGTGLVLASWFADIYSAAGGDRLGGRPRALPALAVELGALWQHDAYVGERAFALPALELRRGRGAAPAAGLAATDGSALGGRVDVEVRPWSRAPRGLPPARHTGTALAVRGALQLHAEREQGYTLTTGELAVRGRLHLARVDAALAGSFVELEEGLGLELAAYDAGPRDLTAILLSRFAWGVYLPCARGELSVFYDHRRDHLAGGFPAGPAAGFFGSLGATADVVLGHRLSALAQLEVGSAWITTVALRRELR